jgi:hypothetical protein
VISRLGKRFAHRAEYRHVQFRDAALAGRAPRRATLAAMPLSTDDLARAAAGCRALAHRNREDAKRQSNVTIREGFEREARALEALAERFEATRRTRSDKS